MADDATAPLPSADDRPVVIFGGSFDPPHRRHVEVARAIDALLNARQILVVPARCNPQRPDGPVAVSHRRPARPVVPT